VIANSYLRLNPQEWVRAVEKRRAAPVGSARATHASGTWPSRGLVRQ
jgi:hypothetical protein